MTRILESQIGLGAPTRLWRWDSEVYATRFCDLSEQARFAGVVLHCAGCQGPFGKSGADVCYAPDTEYDAEPSVCPALEEPAQCEGDFPERAWPEEVFVLPDGGLTELLDAGLSSF